MKRYKLLPTMAVLYALNYSVNIGYGLWQLTEVRRVERNTTSENKTKARELRASIEDHVKDAFIPFYTTIKEKI